VSVVPKRLLLGVFPAPAERMVANFESGTAGAAATGANVGNLRLQPGFPLPSTKRPALLAFLPTG